MLAEVRELIGSARPGRCVIVRGRRRIGKSALVEEFIEQQQVPNVFYTAEIGFGGEPLREFSDAVRTSGCMRQRFSGMRCRETGPRHSAS
jgi:AAA+ ATPase superfamily predicted ATPase